MPDAPAGDALTTARRQIAAWLATIGAAPVVVRSGESKTIHNDREFALDALIAAARAEGAAEERKRAAERVVSACYREFGWKGDDWRIPRLVGVVAFVRSPSSGTAAPR